MERRSPLYDYHLRNSSQLVKGGGDFMFPLQYTSAVEEHINTRTNVGMQDLSSMGEVDIKGPGAERLINRLIVNDIRDLMPGQARYSTMVNERGGVLDDITVYKFSDDHFMIVTSSGPRKKTARWIMEYAEGSSAYATDVTAAIALPVVQGPRSREFLKTIVEGVDLDTLKYFRFAPVRINETELILSRSGYTGELGYELYTPAEEAGVLWEFLLNAGKPFGLKPYGVSAMQTLRLEKAYPLYGSDITEDVTPFHVGLDRWIRFDKREFIGRDALLRVQEQGIDERLTGLILEGDMPANARDPIYPAREVNLYRDEKEYGPEAGNPEERVFPGAQQVGYITYSNKGHTVGQVLALAYIRTTHTFPGSRLVIETNGRWIPATVAPTPFFDPGGLRLRA